MGLEKQRIGRDFGRRWIHDDHELWPAEIPFLKPVRGDIISGQASGGSIDWKRLALGASGKVIRSDGTDPLYSTFTIPNTFALGDILYSSAANVLTALAAGTNNFFLKMGATVPAWFNLFGTANTWTATQTIQKDNASAADRADQFIIKGSTNTNLALNFGIHTEAATPYADIGFVEDTVSWRDIVLAKNNPGKVSVGSATWGAKFSVYGTQTGVTVGLFQAVAGQTVDIFVVESSVGADFLTVGSAGGVRIDGKGLGVNVAPPATAGDVQIGNALGVNVAPPTNAGYVKFDHSDATQGGQGLIVRNSNTSGDAGIQFDTNSFRANLWQIFLSESNSRMTIGRDALADYLHVRSTGAAVPSGLFLDALTDGSTGGLRAGASSDVLLYRGAADAWQTPDSLIVDSGIAGGGSSLVAGAFRFLRSSEPVGVFNAGDSGTANQLAGIAIVHSTTGTAAAGFGADIIFQFEDDGGTNRSPTRLRCFWDTAAAATRKSVVRLLATTNAVDSAACFEIRGTGTANLFNFAFMANADVNYQSMVGGIYVANVGTAPSGNPTGGGFMYSSAGAGTWRGSGGTTTTFAPAGPICEKCLRDDWINAKWNVGEGWYDFLCGSCNERYHMGLKRKLRMTKRKKREMIHHGITISQLHRLMNFSSEP